MAWSDEMIEQLVSLWQSGLTTNEIAKELGMSKNSIVGKVHRLNLVARPSPIKKKDDEKKEDKKNVKISEKKKLVDTLPEKKEQPKVQAEHSEPVLKVITPKTEQKDTEKCIKLSELNNHTCRWPIGDPKDENFCFCGKKVRAGQTYCDEHSEIAYVKQIKK